MANNTANSTPPAPLTPGAVPQPPMAPVLVPNQGGSVLQGNPNCTAVSTPPGPLQPGVRVNPTQNLQDPGQGFAMGTNFVPATPGPLGAAGRPSTTTGGSP